MNSVATTMRTRNTTDIDEIVHLARFPGWQDTLAGECEIKKVYSYIRKYY